MNLSTIEVDQKIAAKHFATYRAAVRERHSHEDEQIMRCYKALSKGQKVVNVIDAIVAAGADARGLPRLAICRADADWCWWHINEQTFSTRQSFYLHSRIKEFRLAGTPFPRTEELKNGWPHTFRAAVPVIPPQFRPVDRLGLYHVLWEAEWQRVPPKDPILLRRIGGPLFAVLAQWDLTEVERAVMQQRFV